MMKLDAKLVAYLAGEDMSSNSERLESLEELQNASSSISQLVGEMVEERFCEQQLDVFKSISAIKLQMEALTLQPEGTKRMELLQSDIRPIFTVECQLSHELIQGIPHSDMFHIMQFESEKFQSLTQCTRFGQESQRDVRISVDDDASSDDELNFGRIHFTVWWREPGTCLNEMLGMGVLDLKELYNASLLEQCKCITINRRGTHLASLYFKISLQLARHTAPDGVQAVEALLKNTSIKQCSGDNGEGEKKGNVPQTSTEKAQSGKATAATEESNSASSQNNNLQLDSSHFTAETSKVRLLKGFIYASETRNFEVLMSWEYFLVCRRFWQEEAFATVAGAGNCFNYQEQFSVINEQKFLNRVDKQHLQLEVWRRSTAPDGNGNGDGSLEPVGIVRLPLHQFFIAYRDAAITNHLCKGKLPVISIDAWVPITNCSLTAGVAHGELKCLLAIGSEEQIINLKESRGFSLTAGGATSSTIDNALCPKNALAEIPEILEDTSQSGTTANRQPLKKTTDLLGMLQKALAAQPPGAPPPTQSPPHTSASTSQPLKPMQQAKTKSFMFTLDIQSATGLPLNPSTKAKKGPKRSAAAAVSKRFPPNEAPSTYVTFQADSGNSMVYKSHEGVVYATTIFEKSTNPLWQNQFCVGASVDYLTNPQKRFILKIWKKAATDMAEFRLQPTPMDDAIIGFASLDLTAFLQSQNIGGFFNIVDFNGRINGQLEVRCQPLDDIHKILQPTVHVPLRSSQMTSTATSSSASVDSVIDQFENSLDLSHLNLGQAIKRKFTELEEISQRLRSRLVDVTGEQLEPNFNISGFDSWQPLDAATASLDIDDDDLDEFERDINTPQLSPNTTTAQNDNNDTKTISGATEPSPKE